MDGNFLTIKKFLNDYFVACVLMNMVKHDFRERGFRLSECLANIHTLSKCKSTCFDDDGCTLFANVHKCLIVFAKNLEYCCWYSSFTHQIFSERFGRFNFRGGTRRAENPQSSRLKSIYDAKRKRVIGSNNSQTDFIFLGKLYKSVNVVSFNRNIFCDLTRAAVSGRNIKFSDTR